MKIDPSKYSSRILTGLIAAAASFALPLVAQAQISPFPFTLDGKFTGFGGGPALGLGAEWSDVTPFAFNSVPGFTATPVAGINDPSANTALYAAISHNVASGAGALQLHLLYDFLPRTTLPLPGETFASVTFPVTLGTLPKSDISVLFIGNGLPSFFDVFVDLLDGSPIFPSASLGILGATQPALSPLGALHGVGAHLIAELEVPLRIDLIKNPGFAGGPLGGGAGGGGINPATGLYDPDPVFWGAAGAGNGPQPSGGAAGPLQSASAATIQINPNGSLSVTPGEPVPEPTSVALLFAGVGAFVARRRRQAA